MEKNIEMDTTILKKNLEITKLTQQVDSLQSQALNDNIILQGNIKSIFFKFF